MKKRLLFILSIVLSISAFSQDVRDSYDKGLLARYTPEQISVLSTENPYLIEYWTFYLHNRFEVMDIAKEKSSIALEEIDINLDDFNILEMDIESFQETGKTYRIKGTNKMLVIHAKERFITLFNEFRKTKAQ